MSEIYIPLRPEVEDLLDEKCRDCLYARNLLKATVAMGEDPATEAARINSGCPGWQGEEAPQASLINADNPALAISNSLTENCPIENDSNV